MFLLLLVAGIVWFALAAVMVFAVACAARSHLPEPVSSSNAITEVSTKEVEQEAGASMFGEEIQGVNFS